MSRQYHNPTDPAIDALLAAPADRPVALLHSGRYHPRWAIGSLFARPLAWFCYHHNRQSTLKSDTITLPKNIELTHQPWRDLRTLLHHPQLPGRWVGYFSYDIARVIESTKLPAPPPSDWPLIELGYCPEVQSFEPSRVDGDAFAPPPSAGQTDAGALTADFTRAAYEAAVQRVIDYIAAGDVFQVNLAQRFTTHWQGDPRKLFATLASISPAWYGAFLQMPGNRAILSTSPELFLQAEDRNVITRPIKGTLGKSDIENPTSEIDQLLHSEKDIAELNMIVDLMRNDLGRVCAYGSVKVAEPRIIETHPTVHHGVATITGRLHESRDIIDLLRATLPGGSVTGAPKVRAMQIIEELEPIARGPYCGAIGWLTRDACQFNIAIRTMMIQHDQLSFHVGGGIVADSTPPSEYEETLTKAQAMLRAISGRTT